MARVMLAMDSYQEVNADDEYFVPDEVMHKLIDGLDVTYNLDTGWANVFGESHLEFVGSRMQLVALIDRYEEDEELRPELYDDIEDVHVDVCRSHRGGACNCYVGHASRLRSDK